MTHAIADRVKETSSTTGTGAFTLTGAVAGFDTFASVLTVNGDTTWYSAVNGAEWEVGLCTRTSSTTYARTTVLSSSNADALVSFTVGPTIFCTVPASILRALTGPAFHATQSADQSISNITFTKINFGTETFDTNGCFATGRFTPNVPGYYQINWTAKLTGTSSMGACLTHLYKNGAKYTEGSYGTPVSAFGVSTGSALVYCNGSTDYVEVFGYISGTGTLNVLNDGGATHFSGHLARAA